MSGRPAVRQAPSDTARAAAAGSVSQPKRTLTPDNFLETVTNLVTSLPVLLPAFVSPSTSAALREKVFLGVTSINDCRYCKWLHTRWSMDQGVTLEEVKQILARAGRVIQRAGTPPMPRRSASAGPTRSVSTRSMRMRPRRFAGTTARIKRTRSSPT